MKKSLDLLETAKRVLALAQAGLHYTESHYDRDRYVELERIGHEMMAAASGKPVDEITPLFEFEVGYPTPKVDVRAVVFREQSILLVQERVDGRWSLPGGWADIGLTPKEVAEKETFEEAGLRVRAQRVLALLDKKCHAHPPDLFHVYKFFILCETLQGALSSGSETTDARFFLRDSLPEFSTGRNTRSQIELMFAYLDDPSKPVSLD